ncbi:hypothetical protein [Candidatus Parabeggiatoa sp. HSG14]|uniref:hypothetical protein n=1 Tax=Candidatus Parabeggiatoa sp. HSG14 TaxID=3055593 RepID=UPI0025A8A9CA|nr:hypothetical protein [Thiotrichales bacterium HSG14]
MSNKNFLTRRTLARPDWVPTLVRGNQKILLWLWLTIAYGVSANTDYEPWWGDTLRESEWILGQGYLAGSKEAPFSCLTIPAKAIQTRQKQLTFRLTYLKNKGDINQYDVNFIERAQRAVESTKSAINKKPYYTLVLTITIEKEKRLYSPLLQLTDFSQQLLDTGDMQQFYRHCGTHYIQSALVESSMRLWISYHPQITEQAEKLQQLLSTNFPDDNIQDMTRLSWFETLEKENIGVMPTRIYMEGWGNGPITPPFPKRANGQPVDHTLVTGLINQALSRIYQPQGGKVKQVHRLPWLSSYPAVATYCIHHPLKCDLKNFYFLNEIWETKIQWRKRYRFLALTQTHPNADLASLRDCFRLFRLLDTQNQTAQWLQCQKDSYQKKGEFSKSCQTLAETINFCDQSPICYNCARLLELTRLCGEPCQRYPDLLAFEPALRETLLKQPLSLGQSWNKDDTVCLTDKALKKRDLPEKTVQTILLVYPISHSPETMSYQTRLDYRQHIGLEPNHWTLKPDIKTFGKGRTFFRACGSHYAYEIRFSQKIAFQTHYKAIQQDNYQLEYNQLKTECDAPTSQVTPAAYMKQLSLSTPDTFSCPIEVIFRPWYLDIYKNLTNPALPIEDCPPKLSPQDCWQTITKGVQDLSWKSNN